MLDKKVRVFVHHPPSINFAHRLTRHALAISGSGVA